MENLVDNIGFLNYSNPWVLSVTINTILLGLALVLPKKLLTVLGILHAWLLGIIVWGTLGWQGYAVVIFYFLVGSLVTKVGIEQKQAAGIAEKRSGARGPENVWGSALSGTICAVGTLLTPQFYYSNSNAIAALLVLGYVASFSTKLSDTCASEIGKAYGRHTFLITTLKPVPRGTEGAVSLEGTLAGIIGSLAIALVGWGVGLIDTWGIIWCLIAAAIATNIESLIGATLQNKYDWLTNEVVNFLNTTIGAIAAIVLAVMVRLST
jgi:uncharacterized protein (TIGR00297 family)